MFRFVTHTIIVIVSNAIAIWAAARYVPGVSFTGTWADLAIAAIVLTFINMFIRPIIRFVLSPFIILSLGLGVIAINMGILYSLDLLLPTFTIQGFIPLLYATFLISIVNVALQAIGGFAFRS